MFSKLRQYFSRHRWLNILLQFTLLLSILVAVGFWQTRHAARGVAPDFTGHLADTSPVALSNYRGKPLLLHFWATWCPVCKLEQNSISNIAQSAIIDNIQVLTIASWSGTADEVMHYMQTENIKFPVLIDQDGSLAKRYGVQAVPSSFVLDAKGVVQFVEQGYTSESGLRLRLWWLQNH
jgi:peroxiredoxin